MSVVVVPGIVVVDTGCVVLVTAVEVVVVASLDPLVHAAKTRARSDKTEKIGLRRVPFARVRRPNRNVDW